MITFSAELNEFDPSLPRRANVTLPAWVNEPLPSYSDLLSAHDVARLTRRPRLVVLGMMLIGRFPRKQSFHGRRIGWLRDDVLDWIGKGARFDEGRAPLLRPRFSRREGTGACAARRSRNACSTRRPGGP